MTDEEIEKTLRRNADNIGGGFNSRVLDYINRLKAENERLMKAHINKLELLTSEMKNGEIDMKFGGEFCDAFVYSIVQMFNQNHGENFVTATFEMNDRDSSERYALTIQKVGKITPLEKREKEVAVDILKTIKECKVSGALCAKCNRYVLGQEEYEDIAYRYGVEVDNE